MIFETKKDLIDWLNDFNDLDKASNGNYYPNCTYYLHHGEYAQPEYRPTRYKDGWSIKGVFFYYSGTLNAPINGRLDINIFSQMYK